MKVHDGHDLVSWCTVGIGSKYYRMLPLSLTPSPTLSKEVTVVARIGSDLIASKCSLAHINSGEGITSPLANLRSMRRTGLR